MEINPSTVARVILLARELDASIGGLDSDSSDTDSVLEARAGDTAETELRALIHDMNEDEQAEIVAIMWVGRDTFAAEDWDEALQTAKDEHPGPTADYLLGAPLLADYLEDGLSALGYDVGDLEDDIY